MFREGEAAVGEREILLAGWWLMLMSCSAGGFSRILPATTVFFSHAKLAQPPANQPANSIFLSREISQPSSQPAS